VETLVNAQPLATDPMHPDDLTAVPDTDPLLLYRYRDGLYAPDMLITALVHLDLFSWLATHPSSRPEICRAFDILDRPTDVMLTLLAAVGLVDERDGVFHVTDIAREHFVAGSPWFLGPYYASLKDRPIATDLLDVLRTGKPGRWGSQKNEKVWLTGMETEEFAASFTAAMDARGVYMAQAVAKAVDLKQHRHVLDVAGGSGVYACSLVAHFPHLHATVLEKPPVDRIAARAIAKRGWSEHVSVVASDMLAAPIPAIADVHLFSNVLHDWDVPIVKALLTKSFAALPAGGMVVVHDAHLNRKKTGPLHVAEYSVLLVHSCEGRCYSVAEMEGYLHEAGFRDFTYAPGAAARSIVTGSKPA
jgi:predicted nicotinamide N-methyase